MRRDAFKDAVAKMNKVTLHQFVYRRLEGAAYKRYPKVKK
jgi:hypothetical protein